MFCCSWQDVKTWMPSICTSPELAVILGAGTPALCVNRGLGFVTEKAVFLLCKDQGLFVSIFMWNFFLGGKVQTHSIHVWYISCCLDGMGKVC